MRIISNNKSIERNRKIGLYTMLGSMAVLIGGFVLSMQGPEWIAASYGLLLVGLLLSQIGVYYGNRWGRSPRIDEQVTAGLKGLDDRYTLYHYTAPVPHLLTGPAGVWVVVPMYQPGTITFEKGRFKQRGVFFLQRFFGQESIGRPDQEAEALQSDLQKRLVKHMGEGKVPPLQSVIVFCNPKANVQVTESPTPAMHVEKLKDFIRRKAKERPIAMSQVEAVEEILPSEDII